MPKDQQLQEQQTVHTEKHATTVPVSESYFAAEDLPPENVHIVEDTEAHIDKDIVNKGAEEVQDPNREPSDESTGA